MLVGDGGSLVWPTVVSLLPVPWPMLFCYTASRVWRTEMSSSGVSWPMLLGYAAGDQYHKTALAGTSVERAGKCVQKVPGIPS